MDFDPFDSFAPSPGDSVAEDELDPTDAFAPSPVASNEDSDDPEGPEFEPATGIDAEDFHDSDEPEFEPIGEGKESGDNFMDELLSIPEDEERLIAIITDEKFCPVCEVDVGGDSAIHVAGRKHKKSLSMRREAGRPTSTAGIQASGSNKKESQKDRRMRKFIIAHQRCPVCDVSVLGDVTIHIRGRKHRNACQSAKDSDDEDSPELLAVSDEDSDGPEFELLEEGQSGDEDSEASVAEESAPVTELHVTIAATKFCPVCEVEVSSGAAYHMNGRKHRRAVEQLRAREELPEDMADVKSKPEVVSQKDRRMLRFIMENERCPVCYVPVTGDPTVHMKGRKHLNACQSAKDTDEEHRPESRAVNTSGWSSDKPKATGFGVSRRRPPSPQLKQPPAQQSCTPSRFSLHQRNNPYARPQQSASRDQSYPPAFHRPGPSSEFRSGPPIAPFHSAPSHGPPRSGFSHGPAMGYSGPQTGFFPGGTMNTAQGVIASHERTPVVERIIATGWCDPCQQRVRRDIVAEHIRSPGHERAVRNTSAQFPPQPRSLQRTPARQFEGPSRSEKQQASSQLDEKTIRRIIDEEYLCPVCEVTVNKGNAVLHLKGRKHKAALERNDTPQAARDWKNSSSQAKRSHASAPTPTEESEQSGEPLDIDMLDSGALKQFITSIRYCPLCDAAITVDATGLNQHMNGRRHQTVLNELTRVAGMEQTKDPVEQNEGWEDGPIGTGILFGKGTDYLPVNLGECLCRCRCRICPERFTSRSGPEMVKHYNSPKHQAELRQRGLPTGVVVITSSISQRRQSTGRLVVQVPAVRAIIRI